MGGIGSDIAVDAADIALVNDDIREIPHLLRLSKRMMRVIKYNLTFFHGPELFGDHPGYDRGLEPCCGRFGP